MTDPSWTSLLPALLAIALAIATRQVYLSLAAGVWLGTTLLAGGNPLVGLADAIDACVKVLGSAGDARAILFTLVIGALIATLEHFGGVKGFVGWLEGRRFVDSARRAQWLAWVTGVIIFIESNITVLVAGALARPVCDRHRVSREKLAYLIDSTSAPICILIPLNAWGAYCLRILDQLGLDQPLSVFVAAVPYNFYALAAVALSAATIAFPIDLGPMRKAEERTRAGELLWPGAQPMIDSTLLVEPDPGIPARAPNMILPIVVMVVMMPIGLWLTGKGDIRAGSGSTSVLWAVLAALAIAWGLLLAQRIGSIDQLTRIGLRGAGGLVPLALILLLALALGGVVRQLGTGRYVASLAARGLPRAAFLPLTFLIGAFVSFSTGTSWGTFAIMLPIAVPAAKALSMPLSPAVAAGLSGGVFGDHSSPISDTTVVSSMAAATDHIDHVRTQLPYALLAAAFAALAFGVVGVLR